MDILKVNNVSKKYTGHLALDNVSLTIPEGTIYGLLGPNGAGKTTLIRIINHITAPDTGSVEFMGHPLTANDVVNIGYLPEERGLYKKMRVGEQALFFAKLKGLKTKEATAELRKWFDRFGISDWWNRKVEELSKGMAQKVQFIVTVLHRPKLLIFDEPFSGFDPINADLLKNEILRLRDEGATVIFSTHNMESVEALCDNITLINRSHNILSGNVNEIRQEMGKGRYSLSFEGDPQNLLNALGDRVIDHTFTSEVNSPVTNAKLLLKPDATIRQTLALANDAVDIVSFDRALPSMNEIFIQTVKNNEQ
ncbi:MAG: ATP-binding cassette domain-containing protein [Muribaculaceae bacterium]|nr:ATP-binding cassette domain-containing protein [Muribaculaceae bacterium]